MNDSLLRKFWLTTCSSDTSLALASLLHNRIYASVKWSFISFPPSQQYIEAGMRHGGIIRQEKYRQVGSCGVSKIATDGSLWFSISDQARIHQASETAGEDVGNRGFLITATASLPCFAWSELQEDECRSGVRRTSAIYSVQTLDSTRFHHPYHYKPNLLTRLGCASWCNPWRICRYRLAWNPHSAPKIALNRLLHSRMEDWREHFRLRIPLLRENKGKTHLINSMTSHEREAEKRKRAWWAVWSDNWCGHSMARQGSLVSHQKT
ncbi:hypothetical protein VNO77_02213 [Canavalia gladiata]|uniref:Uncharacterized protein n=1 Tax=Canavalia gladiata TaxID=3824 RepID=A0AAN9R5W5_CANGL